MWRWDWENKLGNTGVHSIPCLERILPQRGRWATSLCFYPYFQPLRVFFSSFFTKTLLTYEQKLLTLGLDSLNSGATWIYDFLGYLPALIVVQGPPRGGWTETQPANIRKWPHFLMWLPLSNERGNQDAAVTSDYKSDDVTQREKGPKRDCSHIKSAQIFRFSHSYVSNNKSTFTPTAASKENVNPVYLPIMVMCKLTLLPNILTQSLFSFQPLLLHRL